MTIIDAHQHVWDPSRARYDWLSAGLAPINRTIGFDELRPQLRAAGVDATVLVQSADNDDDTDLMVQTAAANPEIVAIVAYVPLDSPAVAAERLAELRRNRLVVGIRNLIHDIPDPDWLLRPDVDEGLGVLEDAGVTFDLVAVLPRHLEHVVTLSERHPRLKIVIDHLAKPPVGLADWEPWWTLIERAAENPLVYAKVSGLYSATADSGTWTVASVKPFVGRALEVFGADRLMYGGDWPISVLSGGYQRVWEGLSAIFTDLDPEDQSRILGGTAVKFYGIDASAVAAAREASVMSGRGTGEPRLDSRESDRSVKRSRWSRSTVRASIFVLSRTTSMESSWGLRVRNAPATPLRRAGCPNSLMLDRCGSEHLSPHPARSSASDSTTVTTQKRHTRRYLPNLLSS